MHLLTTSLFAGVATLAYLGLTRRVVRLRRRHRIAVGDGGNRELLAAINSHSNFSQYVPLSLLLLALCEIQGVSKQILLVLGGAILVGRVVHNIAITVPMLKNPILARRIGMLLTLLPMLALGLLLGLVGIYGLFK